MKISKAIELLTLARKNAIEARNLDWGDALQLGIEALKRLQCDRCDGVISHTSPLIGETPEEAPEEKKQ